MIQFNEKTRKKQKLTVMLPRECRSLQKEHVFCLHLILKKIQVLPGKFNVIRRPSFLGFDINTISRAEDFRIERY